MEGTMRTGQTIKMMATGASYQIVECGHLLPLGLEPAIPCLPVRWAIYSFYQPSAIPGS